MEHSERFILVSSENYEPMKVRQISARGSCVHILLALHTLYITPNYLGDHYNSPKINRPHSSSVVDRNYRDLGVVGFSCDRPSNPLKQTGNVFDINS